MKTSPSSLPRMSAAAVLLALPFWGLAPCLQAAPVAPVNSTWIMNPENDSWNNTANWNPAQVPGTGSSGGQGDTANFGNSSITTIFLGSNTTVGQMIFGAPSVGAAGPIEPAIIPLVEEAPPVLSGAYTINTNGNNLDFYGQGIINNSGQTQVILNESTEMDPTVSFHKSSSAGSNVVIINGTGGHVSFYDDSNAGSATIINQADNSYVYFDSSARSGPGVSAANAMIYNEGNNSFVEFANLSSGGKATIINANPTSWVDISQISTSSMTLGAIAGSGNFYLGSKNLIIGGNNMSTTFSGVFSDGQAPGAEPGDEEKATPVLTGGSLTKVGTGTLTLTGINTYTGNTTVNGGTLLVDGSIASPNVYVNPGGMLGGTGLIGGNVINNGMVMPGDAPGTITFKGNYTQGPTGTLVIQLQSSTIYDQVIISGSALLGGNLVVDPLDGFKFKRGEKFNILIANGGISGQFSSIIQPNNGTLEQFGVLYRGNEAILEAETGSFVFQGLTPNETAVARDLNRVVNDGRESKLINYLTDKSLADLPGDFDTIAAEELTSIFTLGTSFDNVQSLNLQRRTDDIRAGVSGFSAAGFGTSGTGPSYSSGFGLAGPSGDEGKEVKEVKNVVPEENRWGAFITGVGEWVGVSDDYNARGYQIDTGGFTLGIDYKVCPNFAIGLMAGYVGTGIDLTEGGRVFVNGGKVGLYGTAYSGGLYTDFAVTGGYSNYDTRRAALQGTARGETDGGDLNALFGIGYEFKVGGFTFGPTGTFNYTDMGINDFTETGSLAPLHYGSQTQDSLRTAFGAKASYDCKCGKVLVKPEIRAAWQHEYGVADYALNSSFAGGAGDTFTVTGPHIGRDSALIGAGVSVQWNERVATYVYYDGELGRNRYDSQNVSGGIRVSF